MQVHWTTSTDG